MELPGSWYSDYEAAHLQKTIAVSIWRGPFKSSTQVLMTRLSCYASWLCPIILAKCSKVPHHPEQLSEPHLETTPTVKAHFVSISTSP